MLSSVIEHVMMSFHLKWYTKERSEAECFENKNEVISCSIPEQA